MKKILFLLLMLCSITLAVAQSGYSSGRYYSVRGTSDVTCSNVIQVQKWNGYNYYYEGWQNCRRREWVEEQYSGYIYTWDGWNWQYQWQTGYFWRFYWYDFQVRVY